jgi:peptide deformylase
MAIRKIIIAPDPILDTVAQPVTEFDDSLRELVADMIDTMLEFGSGLAANQIGVLKRVLVLNLVSYIPEETMTRIIINPEITYASEETWVAAEGCLSFPDMKRIEIERPENIKLKYFNEYGVAQELTGSGWLARGIQHELDHLNGITMVHYVSKMKRDLILKKLTKMKQHNEEG